jgi:sterol desaturase/sphingolipid hydroxylase (fatty acid hydroxylase superfamily)
MDSTIAAIPVYFGTMGAEYLWLRGHAEERGPTPADYERRDTITSLTMGLGSLLAPIAVPKLFGPITPGKGKYGKALVVTAATAAAATTVADFLVRRNATDDEQPTPRKRRRAAAARRVARVGGVVAVATGGIAITSTLASRTTANRMWNRRLVRDLGRGPAALAVATLGWDFIYYWNHRFMHESRYMWAIHVVHHSSERYNLSTALRQPVADALGTFVPYSLLALLGVQPELIAQARGINLLYQYWIHTDTVRQLGPIEKLFNTPSHHRVHHGSNAQYIDRNHGSILIAWDRLFGTFEPEREPVVYGLTKNLDTFNPARVAGHEHFDMLRDVSRSETWRDRLSFVFRGPGWAYRRHAEEMAAAESSRRAPSGQSAPSDLRYEAGSITTSSPSCVRPGAVTEA